MLFIQKLHPSSSKNWSSMWMGGTYTWAKQAVVAMGSYGPPSECQKMLQHLEANLGHQSPILDEHDSAKPLTSLRQVMKLESMLQEVTPFPCTQKYSLHGILLLSQTAVPHLLCQRDQSLKMMTRPEVLQLCTLANHLLKICLQVSFHVPVVHHIQLSNISTWPHNLLGQKQWDHSWVDMNKNQDPGKLKSVAGTSVLIKTSMPSHPCRRWFWKQLQSCAKNWSTFFQSSTGQTKHCSLSQEMEHGYSQWQA